MPVSLALSKGNGMMIAAIVIGVVSFAYGIVFTRKGERLIGAYFGINGLLLIVFAATHL